MFKAMIPNAEIIPQNSNIGMIAKLNTNADTRYDSSTSSVIILNAGYYDVKVNLPLTNASATPLTLGLYANGELISEAKAINTITATTGVVTFTILDTIRVVPSIPSQNVALSVRLTGGTADVAGDGVFIVERRK